MKLLPSWTPINLLKFLRPTKPTGENYLWDLHEMACTSVRKQNSNSLCGKPCHMTLINLCVYLTAYIVWSPEGLPHSSPEWNWQSSSFNLLAPPHSVPLRDLSFALTRLILQGFHFPNVLACSQWEQKAEEGITRFWMFSFTSCWRLRAKTLFPSEVTWWPRDHYTGRRPQTSLMVNL